MKSLTKNTIKYLEYLNVQPEDPSFELLENICNSHLNTFPFENISKLIYFSNNNDTNFDLPSYELFVNNYNNYNFGGTCYTLNSNLLLLLRELGFDCYHIMLGNVHMGIIVKFSDEHIYVDCGAAAPFFKPVRFEKGKNKITNFGNDMVHLLKLDSEIDTYKYIRYTNGEQSGDVWAFNPRLKVNVSDFNLVIEKSNEPGAPFMSILRCQLYQTSKKRSVSLVNNKFGVRYSNGDTIVKNLSSTKEIVNVLAEEFLLPKLPVEEAINVLENLNVDIFSER